MILIDLNVFLDVLQKREPHYRTSAAVLDTVIERKTEGAVAAHAVTTMHYLVGRYQDSAVANQVIDWLLRHFTVVSVGKEELLRARSLGWDDFEDAVVASAAESTRSETIVTRNVKDFRKSPVTAMTPNEFLVSATWSES